MRPGSNKLKKVLAKNMNERLKQMILAKSPIAQGIKRYFYFEGDHLGVIRLDGTSEKNSISRHEAHSLVTTEEAKQYGTSKMINEISDQLAESQEKAILKTMERTVNSVGNNIDGKNQPFSPELFLEALEAIDIDFDEEDKPCMPTMVCSPDFIDRFKEVISQTMNQEPYKSQYEAVLKKKKEEFHAREASRTLVD